MMLRIASRRSLSTGIASNAAAEAAQTLVKAPIALAVPTVSRSPVDGCSVISYDNGSPIATLGAAIKCGPRFENYDNAGISHALRIAANLSTKNFTSFGKTRGIQQFGTGLQIHQGRESIIYYIQVHRDDVYQVMDFLTDTVCQPLYKPWEVHDLIEPRMNIDLNNRTLDALCTEALHKAAYRTGLGESLYTPERNLGEHGSVSLNDFHARNFTKDRAVFIALGVDNEHAKSVGRLFNFSRQKDVPLVPTKYFGGESRIEVNSLNSCICVAAESQGYQNIQDSLANAILQRILGFKTPIKRGSGSGKLQSAVSAAVGNAPHSISSINYQYSDSGLMGAFLLAESGCAKKGLDAVMNAFRTLKVTPEEVEAAKKKLLIDSQELMRDQLNVAEELGNRFLYCDGQLATTSPDDIGSLIHSVSVESVQALAKKLSSAKFSLSAVGNMSNVPYLDSYNK